MADDRKGTPAADEKAKEAGGRAPAPIELGDDQLDKVAGGFGCVGLTNSIGNFINQTSRNLGHAIAEEVVKNPPK